MLLKRGSFVPSLPGWVKGPSSQVSKGSRRKSRAQVNSMVTMSTGHSSDLQHSWLLLAFSIADISAWNATGWIFQHLYEPEALAQVLAGKGMPCILQQMVWGSIACWMIPALTFLTRSCPNAITYPSLWFPCERELEPFLFLYCPLGGEGPACNLGNRARCLKKWMMTTWKKGRVTFLCNIHKDGNLLHPLLTLNKNPT